MKLKFNVWLGEFDRLMQNMLSVKQDEQELRNIMGLSACYVNNNEIPGELLRENMISPHVRRSPLLWQHY